MAETDDVRALIASFERRLADAEALIATLKQDNDFGDFEVEDFESEGIEEMGEDRMLAKNNKSLQQQLRKTNKQVKKLKKQLRQTDSRVSVLETKTSCITGDSKSDKVTFSGCNVEINNGDKEQKTSSKNGKGNLIIGFNEKLHCPNKCPRTASHSLIVGPANAYSGWGNIVFGEGNYASSDGSAVLGGRYNSATGKFAAVLGGDGNIASGGSSSISGGKDNEARGTHSSVSAGRKNLAQGSASSVLGGQYNTADGTNSAVLGGEKEKTLNRQQTIPKIDNAVKR